MSSLCSSLYIPGSSVYFLFQYDELIQLEMVIKSKITGAGSGTDVGYWESLLQQLNAHMARVILALTPLLPATSIGGCLALQLNFIWSCTHTMNWIHGKCMYIPIGAAESKAPSYAKEETMAAQTRGLPSLINHYCV